MNKFSLNKLVEVSENSLYMNKTNQATILYSFEIFSRYLNSEMKILELGPAEGLMTKELIRFDSSLTVVEAAPHFCKKLREKHKNINVHQELFEKVELNEKYDAIVLGHVLEHVEEPKLILQKIRNWLKPNGIVLCAVPNARSIHRQVAVEMNLISSIFDQSEKDIHHGHMRIYTPETLLSEFLNATYYIVSRGGYWLKPLSDRQIEENWSDEMINSFMKLGEQYPDIAGELYLIAKK